MEGPSTRHPKYNLARHFSNLYDLGHMSPLSMEQAEHVLANPLEHVDALVEARILDCYGTQYTFNKYRVVGEGQVHHTHRWREVLSPLYNEKFKCETCSAVGTIVAQ